MFKAATYVNGVINPLCGTFKDMREVFRFARTNNVEMIAYWGAKNTYYVKKNGENFLNEPLNLCF